MTGRFRRALGGALGLSLTLGLVACTDTAQSSSAEETPSSQNGTSSASGDSSPSVESVEMSNLPRGDDPVDLNPADFTTEIDNPFWPMKPGTRWTYHEIDEEGKKLQVVVIVTHETKNTCQRHHGTCRT